MNIFSNVGITELIFILLLALLVVGPERLPELARQLGKLLRDVRNTYDNLIREIGPELTSLQESTRELRESVDSVRSIPQDTVKSVLKATELDETVDELKGIGQSIGQVNQTISGVQKTVRDPLRAALDAARSTLNPSADEEANKATDETGEQDAVRLAVAEVQNEPGLEISEKTSESVQEPADPNTLVAEQEEAHD
jgi:sec-independent protein translocase protein TatB